MATGTLTNQLDEAIGRILSASSGELPSADSRIAPLALIAGDLKGLPDPLFRSRLKAKIMSHINASTAGVDAATSVDGIVAELSAPVTTAEEIGARLAELASEPGLIPFDLRAALKDLPDGSMRLLASMDSSVVGVTRYSEQSPLWERRPDGDEFLHVLEGALEVTVLAAGGPIRTRVPAGSIFVCPQGLWRWARPDPFASMLFVTPVRGTERSREELPIDLDHDLPAPAAEPVMQAQDVRGSAAGAPELSLSDQTTSEEVDAAFRQLGMLDKTGIFVGRFSGDSPWERHTMGDELLHILEGEMDITIQTGEKTIQQKLTAGSIFVCQKGLWHRQVASAGVLELSATPQPTDISWAADPRV